MKCSTPITVTRKQAQTMLAAVITTQATITHHDPQLEGVRLMLVAALERIGRQETKSMLRVPH